jgi:hypothetical protein
MKTCEQDSKAYIEFKVGDYVWLKIWDLDMLKGLMPRFVAKYTRPYEVMVKPNLDVYTFKLPKTFVAHDTLHMHVKTKTMLEGYKTRR